MIFNNVEITQETILACRQLFADNAQACIEEAMDGRVKVNDLDKYIAWKEQSKAEAIAGDIDHTFTFMQRAYYIQTGEMVALLSQPTGLIK